MVAWQNAAVSVPAILAAGLAGERFDTCARAGELHNGGATVGACLPVMIASAGSGEQHFAFIFSRLGSVAAGGVNANDFGIQAHTSSYGGGIKRVGIHHVLNHGEQRFNITVNNGELFIARFSAAGVVAHVVFSRNQIADVCAVVCQGNYTCRIGNGEAWIAGDFGLNELGLLNFFVNAAFPLENDDYFFDDDCHGSCLVFALEIYNVKTFFDDESFFVFTNVIYCAQGINILL